MTHRKRFENVFGVSISILSMFVAVWVALRYQPPTTVDLALFAVMHFATGFGITIGFHRLFTHCGFQTSKPVRYTLAVLGSMAVQGPLLEWVPDHRKHHAFSDRLGDPHSPHVGFGKTFGGRLRGFWHAHMGWLFKWQGDTKAEQYARDLLSDPGLVFIHKAWGAIAIFSFVLPAVAGGLITGTMTGALTAFLWAGFVRAFVLQQLTFSINSVCHTFGTQRFETKDQARNVWWMSLLSIGDSWHHNHHAFPSSAYHGLEWWELDPSGWVIRGMKALGLVWDVREPSRERQLARLKSSADGTLGAEARRAA